MSHGLSPTTKLSFKPKKYADPNDKPETVVDSDAGRPGSMTQLDTTFGGTFGKN